jgi:DNA-binding response OmpR family regulator
MKTVKKVLITESLKPAVKVSCDVMSGENTSVFCATSGEEIVKIHRTENVDLIMSDLDLPGMDGDEACSVIRSDDALKKVSIIMLCEKDNSSIMRCHESRANAFLTKPVKAEELSRNVRRLLHVDRRRNIRIILHSFVMGRSGDNTFFANSMNISRSGILLETDEALPKGEKIKCSFYIKNNLINIDGEIVRVVKEAPDQYYYGVRFTELDSLTKTRIEQFVKKI